jgi:hypothetical protein
MHEGPLVIPKHQKFIMKHELEEEQSQKIGPNDHFKFDDSLNQVFDIGPEVEIVRSTSLKPKQHVTEDNVSQPRSDFKSLPRFEVIEEIRKEEPKKSPRRRSSDAPPAKKTKQRTSSKKSSKRGRKKRTKDDQELKSTKRDESKESPGSDW